MKQEFSNVTQSKTVILRRSDVSSRTGLARSTIYDHMSRGTFPKPIRIGSRIVGWLESEIEAWLVEQIQINRGGSK